MNQRQFDEDMDDEQDDDPLAPHPIRRLFDQHRQRSHHSESADLLEWCHHCNAWTYHLPERCPKTKFRP